MNGHKSRFKSYLIPHSELAQESTVLAPTLRALDKLRVSDNEKVFLFICSYLQMRAPDQWWMRKRSLRPQNSQSFLLENLPVEFDFLKKFSLKTINDFAIQYDFKKLPGAILKTILSWQPDRLFLKTQTITPFEMLEFQARGQRIVTLDMDAALVGRTVDGARDALDFLLHDLVHADLFFGEDHLLQKSFFAQFEKIIKSGFFNEDLKNDLEFQKDIYYLVSDMNSHVQHMWSQLEACLVKHQLVREGQSPADQLTAIGKERVQEQLRHCRAFGDRSESSDLYSLSYS